MLLEPAINATHVSVALSGTTIVRDVSFRLGAGEVVALLGANGSGKSTLVRALVGILPLAAGQVQLLGTDLGKNTPWGRIGYVPQRSSAAAGVPATAEEIVTSGLLAGRRLRPRGDIHAQTHRALDRVDLADQAHTPIQELSGGQQQRVLIARALVREPDLLVMDEPVAGVDLHSQEAFTRALADLHAHGTTILVVLHEIGPLTSLVERAIVLRHGQIVADGPVPEPAGEHGVAGHVHLHPHADTDQPPADTTVGLIPGTSS